jgi:subtilisin
MSLGSDAPDPLILDAIDYADALGVLVVAAAGNDGPADGSIDYPGAYWKVVAVAASDSGDAIAPWSSRGNNYATTPYINEERDVEFAAPGVAVESTWNNGGYATISGTSMATPHMAGLAAKLWQGSAAATRGHLQTLALAGPDLGRPGDDPDAGFGLPRAP